MAQTSALKGAAITGLDTQPPLPPTTGESGAGYLRQINDFVTTLSTDNIASTYRIVRVPFTAKIKKVLLNSAAATAGNGDINIAYSDAPLLGNMDGTPPALAGTIVQVAAADNKLFGSASNLVAQTNVDVTFAGTFTQAMKNQPLWKALGLARNPNGYADFLIKLTTGITVGGVLALDVQYVE